MLLSPRKNGLTSLFKEVRVFKVVDLWAVRATDANAEFGGAFGVPHLSPP